MAIVVASELTTLETADVTGNFTRQTPISYGKGSVLSTTATYTPVKSGSSVLAHNIDNGDADCYYDTFTATDYSGEHFFVWGCMGEFYSCGAYPATTDISGIYILVRDSSSNIGYMNLTGAPDYGGQWQTFVCYLGGTFDANEGTDPNPVNCDGLGIGFYNDTQNSKATYNCFFDYLRISSGNDGLKITTTLSSVADFDDIVSGNSSEGLLIETPEGVYRMIAPLRFGDTSSGDMEFSDTGKTIVIPDVRINAGFTGITVEGNSTGTIKWQIGAKSGTRGIQGCTLQAISTAHIPFFTATDTDIDELKLYGSTFVNWGTFQFPVTATGREAIDCNFIACGEVQVSTMIVKYCNFIDAPDGGDGVGAIGISSTSHNVSNCSLINCATGIHIDTAGNYSLTNVNFSGCTNDVDNSASGTDTATYTTQDSTQSIGGSLTNDAVGESFTGDGNELANAVFYLKKTGSPTGNIVAKVYTHSGTFGSSSIPTGTALATSENVDIATAVTASYAEVRFRFNQVTTDNNITLTNSVNYVVTVEYSGGDGSNYLDVGYDAGAGAGEPGNMSVRAVSGGTWTAQANDDAYYKVRTGGIVVVSSSGATDAPNQSKAIETATIPGSTTVKSTVTLSVTCKDAWLNNIEGVRVRIEKTSDGSLISQGETNASGVYSDATYNYVSDTTVDIVIRLKGYVYQRNPSTITSTGMTFTAKLEEDETVNLP
jgi:hypothetical protein